MSATKQKCGTCRLLRPREDGKPFYHAHAYKCMWGMPVITLPASLPCKVWSDYPGTYMQPGEGTTCPCWIQRT